MSPWLVIGAVVLVVLLATGAFVDARHRGRNAWVYALVALLTGPLAVVAFIAAKTAGKRESPVVGRYAAVGAISVGSLAAVIGLIIGLRVHPPTAPFGAIELGLPGFLAGGLAGMVIGGCLAAGRRVSRKHQ